MSDVLILGASSAIAQEVAKLMAADGARLFLVARDPARLDIIADDLRVRGAPQVDVLAVDLLERDRHPEIIAAAVDALSGIDTVLVAHGVLPDQAACEASVEAMLTTMDVNFLSTISLLTLLVEPIKERGGTLAVISSVAGDRGRQSNYVYGAAKAGLSAFLQGLRNRLHDSGVQVLTIKPGFVSTPMTAHIEARGALWAQPEDIAAGIVKAIASRKDEVYLPGFWALIMLIVRAVPEIIFKRLKL